MRSAQSAAVEMAIPPRALPVVPVGVAVRVAVVAAGGRQQSHCDQDEQPSLRDHWGVLSRGMAVPQLFQAGASGRGRNVLLCPALAPARPQASSRPHRRAIHPTLTPPRRQSRRSIRQPPRPRHFVGRLDRLGSPHQLLDHESLPALARTRSAGRHSGRTRRNAMGEKEVKTPMQGAARPFLFLTHDSPAHFAPPSFRI